MDEDELFRKIINKELTICETCDNIFTYIPQKVFCDECMRERTEAQQRAYHEKNREKVRARQKARYHANKKKRDEEE